MSKLTKLLILILVFGFQNSFSNTTFDNKDKKIDQILTELSAEINTTTKYYSNLKQEIYTKLNQLNKNLKTEIVLENKLNLLIKKDQLKDQLELLRLSEKSSINKIRYLKGLSIIKILYEKVLSLDHHFSSIATFNEINKISNPNNYQEFSQVKDMLNKKKDKKTGFNLTSLLGQNIYTSAIDMVVNLFISDASPKEKNAELQKIECILDFTLRMNNDLNTIYFETSFLQKSNDKVMKDLERLFVDYTKPIKYQTSLKDCRSNDDWDIVREKLNSFLEKLDVAINDGNKQQKVLEMQIDLNFPIDRLLQFITQYNSFIDQGGKFYEKFKIILDSYENEQQCNSSLPPAYKKLKSDIDIAIEKFNTAYKPVEINGSKMKEILYGINEYD
ncbi:MAG: hypothetical protein L3J09_04835 [Flavobacteriaceae bacterium]|nr:hypothetical protein [Flavobacteriaceae bacterium]